MQIKTSARILKVIAIFLFLWIILFPLRTVFYLFSEFVLQSNAYTVSIRPAEKNIPKHVHQVFFFETSSTLPDNFLKAQQSCIKQHESYTYTLWNKTMMKNFVENEYPDFIDLYNSYDHWVKRVDAGRYLVLHHFGGWYIDIDVVCKRSVDELSSEALARNASIVVYKTEPVGFTNAVIGISKHHPYLDDVIAALHHSNRWYFIPYLSTMFTTGPTFLLGRYLNYPRKEDFHIISNPGRYFDHLHGSAWHSFDGDVIMYIFNRLPKICVMLVCVCTIVCIIVCINSKESYKMQVDIVEGNV